MPVFHVLMCRTLLNSIQDIMWHPCLPCHFNISPPALRISETRRTSFFRLHGSPSVPGPRYTQDFDSVDKRCVCATTAETAAAEFCPEVNSAAVVVRAALC